MTQCESQIKMVAEFGTCNSRGMDSDSFGAFFNIVVTRCWGVYLFPEDKAFAFLQVDVA